MPPIGPRSIIKSAAPAFLESADIDGEVLVDMLETRNRLFHMYDHAKSIEALVKVKTVYLSELEKLYIFLKNSF